MGVRFRKSIKLGKGAKINFGKTGVSFTVGTRGFHHTVHSSGKKTTSVGIPGTGLSYVSTSGGKRKKKNKSTTAITSPEQAVVETAAAPEKKRKTWLWVLGWLFVFPVPATILAYRSEKLNKLGKIVIVAAVWLLYLMVFSGGKAGTSTVARPQSEVAVEQGTRMVVSENIPDEQDTVLPVEPDDITVIVDDKDLEKDVGNSKVAFENDIAATTNKQVLMIIKVTYPRVDDINIGSDWTHNIQINGERAPEELEVMVGEELTFFAEFVEEDTRPDIGSSTETHIVTEDDVANGFEVVMDVYVKENGGPNIGKEAHFVVTYSFTPNN